MWPCVNVNMDQIFYNIHGIPYIITFIVMEKNVMDASYSMLLGRPLLRDAKVSHD
jgi:hypothetical protein